MHPLETKVIFQATIFHFHERLGSGLFFWYIVEIQVKASIFYFLHDWKIQNEMCMTSTAAFGETQEIDLFGSN